MFYGGECGEDITDPAMFRRKSKCYSKAEHIMERLLKLLMLKLNNEQPILA